ncbi:DUF6157 domain-containing protein [Cohnella lubricantis]|uniref:Uncharacterized protein n=1 Tax=Cohnella lubricantis TaxID=2163172 RepID=A0A841T966_9BACL|nr:DUF6157 family protein [Cohnella lubricantis]MBB6676586.1 hypothetical protein [Cohnella lubricantis]MBP2117403.1 hypothetical protein [Cohnella lubricantis]
MKDRGYYNTLILVSADCPVERGIVPTSGKAGKSAHLIQYELLTERPYFYTYDELLYEVHVRHKGIPDDELKARGVEIRSELFAKPHPCMRASMLPKKYGWGAHFDAQGRIALYGKESPEYQTWIEASGSDAPALIPAMRNKRG